MSFCNDTIAIQETDENFTFILRLNSLNVLVESSFSSAGVGDTEGRNGKMSTWSGIWLTALQHVCKLFMHRTAFNTVFEHLLAQ